jgi:hypothetical protein
MMRAVIGSPQRHDEHEGNIPALANIIFLFRVLGGLAVNIILLAACTVGPDFLAPKAATPPQWAHTALPQKGTSVAVPAEPTSDAWWQSFGDPELSSWPAQVPPTSI